MMDMVVTQRVIRRRTRRAVMQLEPQEGEEGCGIACVAMVAGASYAEAKDKLPKYWRSKGTTKKQMRRGLRSFGITTAEPKPIGGQNYRTFQFDAVLLGYLGAELHWTVWDFNHRLTRAQRKFAAARGNRRGRRNLAGVGSHHALDRQIAQPTIANRRLQHQLQAT